MNLSKEIKISLLRIAREKLENYFSDKKELTYESLASNPDLNNCNGVFVTLKKRGDLRGCIGQILTDTPLIETIRSMAIASAFSDNRFPSLNHSEMDKIEIEISVLSIPKAVDSYNSIKIGRDGIILECGYNSALFLPQVAIEQKWDLQTTLSHLSMKAGLSSNSWQSDNCKFKTFTAIYFSESDFN